MDNVAEERDPYDELAEMLAVLSGDIDSLFTQLKARDDAYLRRAAIRAVFAFVEGLIFGMKQVVLTAPKSTRVALNPGERELLRDERYELDRVGRVRRRPLFLPLAQNIRFAFESFARTSKVSNPLSTSDRGWQSLLGAAATRNRLMHPKSPADLQVSDAELQGTWQGYVWFQRMLVVLLAKATLAARQDVRTLLAAHPELHPELREIISAWDGERFPQ